MSEELILVSIGFDTWHVMEDLRCFKHVREDGEVFIMYRYIDDPDEEEFWVIHSADGLIFQPTNFKTLHFGSLPNAEAGRVLRQLIDEFNVESAYPNLDRLRKSS